LYNNNNNNNNNNTTNNTRTNLDGKYIVSEYPLRSPTITNSSTGSGML